LTISNVQPARGTRDFLPGDVRRREHVIGVIRTVYERYGFEPLETPAFENIETLLGKYGEEGNQLIFKILKRGEREGSGEADLALRYDLTVPLARVIAQHQNELPKFFKRYQIQPVWRADRPARGRFREFYQCDIDAIGSTSPIIEAEQIAAVGDVLRELRFSEFKILVNHRGVLSGLLEANDISADQHETALVALDKLDKIGDQGVEADFAARGIDPRKASRLMAMLRNIYGAQERVPGRDGVMVSLGRLNELRAVLGPTKQSPAVENLTAILSLVQSTPVVEHVYVEPRLARGLSYYTGAIMEIAVEGIGSLGGGGRYDNLIGMFLGQGVPACGFSLGLERIIVVMTEREMFPPALEESVVDVVVTFMDDTSRADALKLASEIRGHDYRVDVYPEASRKLDKPLKYASGRGARVMAIFGANEREKGETAVKNLVTREQTAVKRPEAARFVARLLGAPVSA
jgi:histidyl-tRNA synthetase